MTKHDNDTSTTSTTVTYETEDDEKKNTAKKDPLLYSQQQSTATATNATIKQDEEIWMIGTNCDDDNNDSIDNETDRLIDTSTIMKQSYRSFKSSSEGSLSISATTQPIMSSSLHKNLMRTYINRDPMKHYTVSAILGKGSMGSVAKVHKKVIVKGGSARPTYVKQNHGPCYQFCNSFIPPILARFRTKDAFVNVSTSSHHHGTSNGTSTAIGNNGSNHHHHQQHHHTTTSSIDYHNRTNSSWLLKPSNWSEGIAAVGPATTGSSSITITNNNKNVSFGPIHLSNEKLLSSSTATISSSTTTTTDVTEVPIKSSIPRSTSTNSTVSTSNKKSEFNNKNNASNKIYQHQHSSIVTYGERKETYYALKSIHLDRCSSKEFIDELRNEVEILKNLDHPNIVRAIETFDYHGRLFLVLELCQGGDLYTRDPYTENESKIIVNCLLSAINYMHTKGIVHRDLKFENICFADTTPNSEVRIIDFGLSQKFAANEHLHDAVGTVYTMAPELLKGEYDSKVDVWSIGVIAYSLLSSSLPFFGSDRISVMKKIVRGKYRLTSNRWKDISDNGKNFIHTLLQQNPTIRPTALDALNLLWLHETNDISKPYTNEEIQQLDNIQSSIQTFAMYKTLKKLALMVVAYQSTSEEVGKIRNLFDRFDRCRDGEVTLQEFYELISEHYNYTDYEIESMFHGIDIDGTGKVHYIEFLAATIESTGHIDEERLAEAFSRIDNDSSGYITVSDLQEFLGKDIPDTYIERVINEADIVHDHRVSYTEFLELWDYTSDEILDKTKIDVQKRRRRYKTYNNATTGGVSFTTQHSLETSSIGSKDESGTSFDQQDDDIDNEKDDVDVYNVVKNEEKVNNHDLIDKENTTTITIGDTNVSEKNNNRLTARTGEYYYSQRKFQSMRRVDLIAVHDDIIDINHPKLLV